MLHVLGARARRARAREEIAELADWRRRGVAYAEGWPAEGGTSRGSDENPLRAFFNARTQGRGIFKWDHYFDVYHRHFERFRGSDVHILEIGLGAGGSLEMWRDYFGPGCHVYGVDIQEECLRYTSDSVTVFIGDQEDRDFWRRFRDEVPKLDIVVDDGGHSPHQQATSLEELLPHLQPGGAYVVEDLHGGSNRFTSYLGGLIAALNSYRSTADHTNPERRKVNKARGFQALIDSIHLSPYIAVIEKRREPLAELVAAKHGTEWASFAG